MIKSIASLSKENGTPCMMMNNGLYSLQSKNWLVVSNDKVINAEFGQDSTCSDNECISFKGKEVQLIQYLEMRDLNWILVGLENEIMISDIDTGRQLFHSFLESENATCGLIWDDTHILFGTDLGKILRISVKSTEFDLKEEFNVTTNIWAICRFKDFLAISLESGVVELWKDIGSWTCIKVNESKYPGTCMRVLESEFLLVNRLHGSIDILNSDLCTVISIGAHTGYISGIAFSSNNLKFATISMDQLHLWGITFQGGDLDIESLKTFSFPGYCFCGVSFKDQDIILTAADEYDFFQIDSSHF